jgi:uncharacterized protein YpmB
MDLNLNRSLFKWLIITNIILILIFAITNVIWIKSWLQREKEYTEREKEYIQREKEYNTIVTTEETKTVEDIESAGDIIQY